MGWEMLLRIGVLDQFWNLQCPTS